MFQLENKNKEDFNIDPYNLKYREYQKKRRQQIVNYLHRNKLHIDRFGNMVKNNSVN